MRQGNTWQRVIPLGKSGGSYLTNPFVRWHLQNIGYWSVDIRPSRYNAQDRQSHLIWFVHPQVLSSLFLPVKGSWLYTLNEFALWDNMSPTRAPKASSIHSSGTVSSDLHCIAVNTPCRFEIYTINTATRHVPKKCFAFACERDYVSSWLWAVWLF